jgi:hypothetical protein
LQADCGAGRDAAVVGANGPGIATTVRSAKVRKHDGEFGSPWQAGPERRGRDGRFIVSCPACQGSGRVVGSGSQVPVSCRLCWERGRVARIVAERFERQRRARNAE